MLGEGLEPMLTSLGPLIFAPGLLLVLYTMFVWWRDVILEAEHGGHHSPVVQLGLRYGMALFICSEVMFFVAFFWAFFRSSLYPKKMPHDPLAAGFAGGVWPPAGTETFDPSHCRY